MKQVTVQASGKGWNARVVSGMKEADFVNDPAHAIDGMTPDDNTATLKAIYIKCVQAVNAADAAAQPAAKPGTPAPENK